MDQKTIIIIALAFVLFAVLAYFLLAPNQTEKTAKRASRVATGKAGEDGKGRATGAGNGNTGDTSKDRRRQVQDSLNKIEEKSKEQKEKEKLTLQQRLEQAGLEVSVRDFYTTSLICGVIFVGIGFITAQKFVIIGLMFIVGFLGFPRFALGFLRKRRQKKFVTEFTNAIEVIVRGVKSGLPVNECLKIISRDAQEPVKTEFYLMTEGLRIGLSLEQTLDRMFERMPLNEVRFFGIVLVIQQTTGGNLGEALGNLAGVLRGRKLMEGKVAALSMEAKASAVILGSLPFIVAGLVHTAAPEYLMPMFETREGNLALLGAGIWMSIGIFVMKQMISIKV